VHPLFSTFAVLGDQTGSAHLPSTFASRMYVWSNVCWEAAARVPFRRPQQAFLPALASSCKVTSPSCVRHLLLQPAPLSPGNFLQTLDSLGALMFCSIRLASRTQPAQPGDGRLIIDSPNTSALQPLVFPECSLSESGKKTPFLQLQTGHSALTAFNGTLDKASEHTESKKT